MAVTAEEPDPPDPPWSPRTYLSYQMEYSNVKQRLRIMNKVSPSLIARSSLKAYALRITEEHELRQRASTLELTLAWYCRMKLFAWVPANRRFPSAAHLIPSATQATTPTTTLAPATATMATGTQPADHPIFPKLSRPALHWSSTSSNRHHCGGHTCNRRTRSMLRLTASGRRPAVRFRSLRAYVRASLSSVTPSRRSARYKVLDGAATTTFFK